MEDKEKCMKIDTNMALNLMYMDRRDLVDTLILVKNMMRYILEKYIPENEHDSVVKEVQEKFCKEKGSEQATYSI